MVCYSALQGRMRVEAAPYAILGNVGLRRATPAYPTNKAECIMDITLCAPVHQVKSRVKWYLAPLC